MVPTCVNPTTRATSSLRTTSSRLRSRCGWLGWPAGERGSAPDGARGALAADREGLVRLTVVPTRRSTSTVSMRRSLA